MLIAVTGATGFLGHYIVNDLLTHGHQVRCWYREGSDRGGFIDDPRIQWVAGDLGDPKSNAALVKGADAIVHAALARGYRPGPGGVTDFVEINLLGSVRLMEAAKAAGVGRFVFISTCAVHDVILPDRKLDEAHPLWPHSHYGAHKAAIEKFVHSFGLGEAWPICALRPTGIYGLARPVEESRWFKLVRDIAANKVEKFASGGGGKEVHAADVAKAVTLLLNAPAEKIAGQAFNCYDMYIAEQEVAAIAKELSGSKTQIEMLNKGPRNQIDTTRLRALGLQFGGKSMLQSTVRQLLDAGHI